MGLVTKTPQVKIGKKPSDFKITYQDVEEELE